MAKQDKLNMHDLADEYGYAFAFFKSDPELTKLLKRATNGKDSPWGVARFQAELRKTKWYRQHSDIWRQNDALKYTDPTTYKERLGNYVTNVGNLAGQYGMKLSSAQLNKYATRALMFGWSDAEVLDHLANYVRPDASGHYGGSLAGIEDQLRQTAFNNGVRLDDSQMTNWMRSIVRGDSDSKQYETYIRDVAAKTFTAYADQLRGGMNMMDIASPYIQSMASILEMNPGQIDLYDPTIRKALTYKDPTAKPGEDAQPMSIGAFEDSLRADNRWQYTKQAKNQLQGYAVALGKMWGVL